MDDQLTALDWLRVGIGLVARAVMWACVIFIVGNAVAQAITDGTIALAIAEAIFFPITFFVYPLAAEAGAQAWPLADGTSFLPFLITGCVAYPVSTIIGGMETV